MLVNCPSFDVTIRHSYDDILPYSECSYEERSYWEYSRWFLFVLAVSVDSEFFLCGSRVIFLVCAYFCYSPVIAFLVGGYEYLYDRFIAVPGCR